MCILVVKIFQILFLNRIDMQLGNGFSVYEELIIREQIPFSLLPFSSSMYIPCQSTTDTLSQVYINGECIQRITYPPVPPCKLKENKIESVFFFTVLPFLNTRLYVVALTGSMLLSLQLILQF